MYTPNNKALDGVDGAFFGSSFPGVFLMTFPELRPKKRGEFVEKLCGFRFHPSAVNRPTKLIYDFHTHRYELLPRPVPKFSNDDAKMLQKMASRGPMIVPGPRRSVPS